MALRVLLSGRGAISLLNIEEPTDLAFEAELILKKHPPGTTFWVLGEVKWKHPTRLYQVLVNGVVEYAAIPSGVRK